MLIIAPGLTARQYLGLLKAEAPEGSHGACFFAFPLRGMRLRRVLHNRNIMLLGNSQDSVHVGRRPQDVAGHDGASMLGDPVFNVIRVHLERREVCTTNTGSA